MASFIDRVLDWLATRQERAKGSIDVTLTGFTASRWRKTQSMSWSDVTRIEAGRQPTGHVEIFYVTMTGDNVTITVDDLDAGFDRFRLAVLDRWPAIGDAWTRVFTGPPDLAERVTLWERA